MWLGYVHRGARQGTMDTPPMMNLIQHHTCLMRTLKGRKRYNWLKNRHSWTSAKASYLSKPFPLILNGDVHVQVEDCIEMGLGIKTFYVYYLWNGKELHTRIPVWGRTMLYWFMNHVHIHVLKLYMYLLIRYRCDAYIIDDVYLICNLLLPETLQTTLKRMSWPSGIPPFFMMNLVSWKCVYLHTYTTVKYYFLLFKKMISLGSKTSRAPASVLTCFKEATE